MGTSSILFLPLGTTFLVAVTAAPVSSQTYVCTWGRTCRTGTSRPKSTWYREAMQGSKMLLSDAEEDDGKDCHHHVFYRVFNGFSARLTPAQAAYLEKLRGVLKLYPNRMHTVSTTHSPEFLGLTAKGASL